MPGKPPLDLHAEVTLADGTRYRWDSRARAACDRPQGISFRTKKGDGFADASLTLSRRIDRNYVDLNLYDDFALIGYDGSTAYEGRVGANPRTLSEASHQISVVLQGWMTHAAQDRKFSEVYVDRDLGSWAQMPLNRRVEIGTAQVVDADFSWTSDAGGLIFNGIDQKAISLNSTTEAWYAAPSGVTVAKVEYIAAESNVTNIEGPKLFVCAADVTATSENYALTADSTLRSAAMTTARRFLMLRADCSLAFTAAAGSQFSRRYSAIGVYGNHGLTTRAIDSSTPDGLYASDVMVNIAQRFCPKLNTSGVQATTYAIPHLVYDSIFPFDAFLDLNKYHLWNLAVWENKTLTFKPFDYTDYDWEVRLSDPGVTVNLQGDSVDQFANGIVVNYTDINSQRTTRLTPGDDATLADTSSTNPANTHGLTVWTETTLSSPTNATGAAQIGRTRLAEFNQPKAPGTVQVTGHIRDRAGHWQPVWKVRAGDRIIISDHPNDRVRLVNETDYTHDSKQNSLAIDSSFMRADAVMDRVVTALQAANLI